MLDAGAVHSVINPVGGLSAAIHVFGGDLAHQRRSEWDWETLTERPYDEEHAQSLFDAVNAGQGGGGRESATESRSEDAR